MAKTFQITTLNESADPYHTLTFPIGTHFEAGDIISTPDGIATIKEITPDEDFGTMLCLYCRWN